MVGGPLPIGIGSFLAVKLVGYSLAAKVLNARHGAVAKTTESLWSYALDLPAAFAVFTVPGGMWVC